MSRMRGIALVGVFSLVALEGCSSSGGVSESGYVLLVAPTAPTSHLLAQLDGTLSVSGDCYSLERTGSNYPVIFPPGTTVAGGDIDIPDLGTVALGDRLVGSGGEVPVDASPVDLPGGCASDTVIVFETAA
ncbi:MAG: hypothetical protein ABI566_06035 [Pseudolysinimonas sp.]